MRSSSQITPRCLIKRDGRLDYYENFLEKPEAWETRLIGQLNWRQDYITMFGKTHPIPRLQAWYGDPGAVYTYSRIKLEPFDWTSDLMALKNFCESVTKTSFQGVLCNLYRNGREYAALHSDNEPELGKNPVIASLSFGAVRKFKLRHRDGETVELWPAPGSLIVMSGQLQEFWKHELTKSLKVNEARLNLTYRPVLY